MVVWAVDVVDCWRGGLSTVRVVDGVVATATIVLLELYF